MMMCPGYLDAGSETEDIQVGAKIELPCWLARTLGGGRRRHAVTVELPRQYREVYREILGAEASVVDLHKLGPYYYAFGGHLLQHFEHAEAPNIAKALLKVCDEFSVAPHFIVAAILLLFFAFVVSLHFVNFKQ